MSKRHRIRKGRPSPAPVVQAQPSARWDFRTGVVGSERVLDGSKFRGALMYPSAADLDYSALRLRSRLAAWESPEGRAILTRFVDHVVGTGLSLQCVPVWPLIKHPRIKSPKDQEAFTRDVELRFHLWANSPEASADGVRNLYEIQALAFMNELRDGEYCGILRYNDTRGRISPLSIQHIDAEQIVTPAGRLWEADTKVRGTRVKDGVEVDAMGRMVAVHIAEDPLYPNKTTRVPAWGGGGSGRRWVLHPIISDLIGAVRGTPLLAPMVHELEKLTDYRVAELEATILSAVILGYVTTDVDGEKRQPLTGVISRTGTEAAATSTSTDEPKRATVSGAGIWLQNLGRGQDIKTLDTRHPNSSFDSFVLSVTAIIAASSPIPVEVLKESFNANYSASRASLLLWWKTVTRWREHVSTQLLRPIYESWFGEEVRAGRIDAPGWDDPLRRAAWLNATWDGESLPSIDPYKEAQAVQLRRDMGHTTGEREARNYNGSDFGANVQRLKAEGEMLRDAGVGQAQAPSAPAPADDSDQDDESDDQRGEKWSTRIPTASCLPSRKTGAPSCARSTLARSTSDGPTTSRASTRCGRPLRPPGSSPATSTATGSWPAQRKA